MTTTQPRSKLSVWPIGLILGPIALMLWLGRGRLALTYLLVQVVLIGLGLLAVGTGFIAPPIAADADVMAILLNVTLAIIGLVHGLKVRETSLTRPWFSRWYIALLLPLAAALLLAFIIRSFFFQPFSAPSANMIPSLRIGDYFFVSKTAYGEPKRGDIVVFEHPRTRTAYIMRLIGLPGDRVELREGIVYLNGSALPLTRVEGIACLEGEACNFFREILPDGRSYIINNEQPNGRVDNTQEYVVPDGHYFMMGDNRDNSLDSRFGEQIGYIPRENLIGPAVLIFWNSFGLRIDDRLQGYPTK